VLQQVIATSRNQPIALAPRRCVREGTQAVFCKVDALSASQP
jgi:hypothetical protein